MRKIKTAEIKDTALFVPGSKSYTHRLLIATALSNGVSSVQNALESEDTILTRNALEKMGVRFEITEEDRKIIVHGAGGRFKPYNETIYLANSGTSMRLLTGISALGEGTYTLTGTKRMEERPVKELLDGLVQIGIKAVSINGTGCPPVKVTCGERSGGTMYLDCRVSSQYLSSVLLMAPYTANGININLPFGLVSKPYVDMTVDIMARLGVTVVREGYDRFYVPGNQVYQNGDYEVESDCSQASYFWAAAAITGRKIKVKNISRDSRQGDVRFFEVLERMGCHIVHEDDGISVKGGQLKAVEVDMSNMPDIVPTLAVVASFAEGTTRIKNVAHLKEKECDRLGSVATELIKMGIDATATETGLNITGGNPHGAEIDTYDDHRMAMSFAVAGLVVPGMIIKDELCVKKSFPNYWEVFEGLYR